MVQTSIGIYWKPCYDTLYEAYYQELASEAMVKRLQWIDRPIAFLTAATASGSAIAGWTLWSEPSGKLMWGIFAAVASVASIGHGIIGVPSRVKEQESLRSLFSGLRIDLESLRENLKIGIPINDAKALYDNCRGRLAQYMAQTHPDILYTTGLRGRVQDQLDNILKQKGYTS